MQDAHSNGRLINEITNKKKSCQTKYATTQIVLTLWRPAAFRDFRKKNA